jgi:hypothetical protein
MASDTKAIFISYRRDESSGYAGRIADSFVAHFGEDKVFRDIDSLEPGLDFVEAVELAIESSEVFIAVIGKNWLTATDAAGQKRLDNPDDYVRVETATALKRNIRVVPLLVQGAAMPSARELPEDLAPLSRRNAFEVHDTSWGDDIRRLVTALDRAINGNPPSPDAGDPEPKPSIMQRVWWFGASRPEPEEERPPVAPDESRVQQPSMKIVSWIVVVALVLAILFLVFRLL